MDVTESGDRPSGAESQRVKESRSMTSSEEHRPRRRRGLVWLVLALAVLFGLYSAGWFWAADKVRTETARSIAALEADGIEADCVNLQVGGFPLRFSVTCDSLAYQDDGRNVAASAGGLNASASLANFFLPNVELAGPLRTTAPGMPPLWLDWDRLQVKSKLSWPLTGELAASAEGLSGQTDPEEGEPVSLFSATAAEAQVQPNGEDLDYMGSFNGLQIDPAAIEGRELPPLDGSADATIKNGLAALRSKVRSLRGQSAEFRNLELSSGEARITVAGPVSIDAEGLIDANLTIKLSNPNAVADIIARAMPERDSEIRQGFAALAMLGNQTSMPLKVVKGKASLGFIPLGRIKPVE